MARSQSFFDAELPNDPSSSNQHIPNIDYDDEDIGLDYDEYGVEVNEANGLDYDDEDDVGLSAHGQYVEEEDEDDEIGLDRMPPLPDDDDIFGDHNTSTPAPQDPTITSTNNNLMKVPFNEFAKEVVYTLASKVSGYCNLHELKEDLRKDTGLLPDYVVAHYGFANFEIFMKSELMQPSVKLQIIDGKHYFLPRNCSTFSHIRNEQEIERAATLLNQNREENEKLCRALLPENKEATINGRKLISELVYELGGEEKPVAWQEVQKKYKEKFNEELAGEALKRMFTRDKAIKILETLFTYEMELWQANLPGQFFLKLKMPFNDLVNYYEEELRNHNEAKAQMKNVSGRPMRPRINNHKYPKVFPTCPLYPTFDNPHPPPPPVQQAVNNKKSLDVPNNDVNNSNQLNMPTSSNAATKKSKFDISPEELGISTKKQSFTEMINCEEDDIAEESKITVKYNRKGWAEESSVPAYEIGGGGEKTSRLDPPINVGTNAVQNGGEGAKEDDNKKNKKTRYTSRIAGGDFTDSDEESGDDEDEVVSIKKLPKEERPVEIPKPQSVGENLTSFVPQQAPTSSNNIFVPPPRLSGHRAGIHKFMQEKVEQRKIEGTTSQPQQPNPPPFNPTKQRYPVNYSSDEEDDVNNIFNEKQMSKEKSVENVVGRSVQQQQGGTSVNCTNTAALFDPPPSLPQQQQQPSSRPLPTLSNTSINQQNNTNNSKSVHKDKNANEWLLIDKVEWLRNEANKQKMSHESRPDEGSFIFRKGNEVLVLTESDDRIRASKHCDGRIKWDAYFPKTEWKLFSITVLGLVYSFMLRENFPLQKIDTTSKIMLGNSEKILLPDVSNKCKSFKPPYPVWRSTVCGQDFLCFFTKQFGFSNHYLTPVKIDGVTYCCSEQYYMYMKAMWFGFNSVAKEIMLTNDPSTIKKLGNADTMRQRQANGAELKARTFDHDEWREAKRDVMRTALRAKFEQNPQLFNMLIETGDALLIEASLTDLFWGIGCTMDSQEIKIIDKWRGSNQLGKLLMKLRREFQFRCRANEDYEDDYF